MRISPVTDYNMMFPVFICHRQPTRVNTLCYCDLVADTTYDFTCRDKTTD